MEHPWVQVRTCSRVSAGTCFTCQLICYYGAWKYEDLVLCLDCHLQIYHPEKHQAKLQAIQEAEEERLRLVANPPPGSIRTDSGALMGPPQDLVVGGIVLHDYRQVLTEGLYDRETIKPTESGNYINFFKTKDYKEDK